MNEPRALAVGGAEAGVGERVPAAESPKAVVGRAARTWERAVAVLGLTALLAYLALTPLPPFATDVYGSLVRRYLIVGAVLVGYLVWLGLARRLPRPTPLDLPLVAGLLAVVWAVARSADLRVRLGAVLPLLPALVLFYLLHDATVLDARALLRAVLLGGTVVAVFALAAVWRTWNDWLTLVREVDGGLSMNTLAPPSVPRVSGVGNHP